MKTIEDKLQAAYELGRIAGAAETIDDEATRDCIYGSAAALFDGLLTEAGEDVLERPRLLRSTGNYPPDTFDFVATGEMVASPEPKPTRHTNFSELTKSPESLAEFLSAQPYCGRGEVVGGCNEDCYPCVLKWLNEEAKTDD